MEHLRHLLTPAECLLRALSPSPIYVRPVLRLQPQRRTFIDVRRIAHGNNEVKPRDSLAEFTKDEDIDTPMVRVKQSDGGLGEPDYLKRILRTIDRKTQAVVQLSKPGAQDAAIVQIFEKMDLLKQIRERAEAERQRALAQKDKKPKTLELNWAISEHDMDLKLKQMEQFLDKGKKVELMVASRKRQRKATQEEAQELLDKIKRRIQEVGARETKPMEGGLLRQSIITVKKGA